MIIFEIFKGQNLIQIFTKTHQVTPFLKKLSGEHTPEPPSKAHGFVMRFQIREKTF